jgi:hypothetical protein
MMGWMISTGYGCDRARPYGGVGVHAICMRPDGGSRGGFFPDDRAPWAAGEPDKRTATASLLVAGETTRPARRAVRVPRAASELHFAVRERCCLPDLHSRTRPFYQFLPRIRRQIIFLYAE